MKLTGAIAASYWGAQVKYNGEVYKVFNGLRDTHVNLWDSPECWEEDIPIDQCQLILTPLSKISDSDAVEVAKMAISTSEIKGFKVVQIRREDNTVKVIIEWDGKEGLAMYWVTINNYINIPQFFKRIGSVLHELHYQFPRQCIDFLRASEWNGKHKPPYDCGYGEIKSLIEAGIAVKATK